MVTLKDVARLTRVSAQTVSNVVNERDVVHPETRRRVLAAVDRLGYRPNLAARGLRRRRTFALGFFVVDPSPRYLADPFHGAVLTGLADIARERGYGLVIQGSPPASPDDGSLADPFRQAQVDGAVVTLGGTAAERRRHLAAVRRAGGPFVLLEQAVGDRDDAASVLGRNRSGAAAAVRHLLEAGHRHIGFVIPSLAWPAVEERIRGFRDALRPLGGRATGHVLSCGPETKDAARTATERLLSERPEITALMAANDLLALGVLEGGRRAGRRCPADLAVVGFDDFDLAQWVDPPLTTVRLPGYDMGARACQLLITRLETGRFPERRVELATELVRRGSS
jgi:DNA-binding LacI/PurR family transcriptional regulator